MDKRIMVSLPSNLYQSIKGLASKEYRSVSSLIRESILEKIEDELSTKDWSAVEKGFKDIDSGKGVNWRALKK